MRLNLDRPLIVFDLEATGLDLVHDRIIQIAYIKVKPGDKDGEEERQSLLINPGRPIPPFIQQLTGITDEKVKDAPTFKQIASKLAETFNGCDFAGFNSNRSDIPLLCEEFMRAGIDFDFSKCRLIDAQTIYHKREPRNLAAAYRFYTGHKMEDDFAAHRADQDAEATYRVLQGELDKYAPGKVEDPKDTLNNDMNQLAEESKAGGADHVDFAGRIIWEDMTDGAGKPLKGPDGKVRRHEVFNFGKYKGWAVTEVLHRDPGYYSWMLMSDFTLNTKQVLTRIRLREAKLNQNFHQDPHNH